MACLFLTHSQQPLTTIILDRSKPQAFPAADAWFPPKHPAEHGTTTMLALVAYSLKSAKLLTLSYTGGGGGGGWGGGEDSTTFDFSFK